MARKYAYHAQHLITDNEADNVNSELFGKGVAKEIQKAIKIINDFASFDEFAELKKNKDIIIAELQSCTYCGQASQIMRRVRRRYL